MMEMKNQVFAIFVFCGIITGVLSATGADAKSLRKKLFVTDEYDKRIRPKLNQSDYIIVYVDLYLISINKLDEVAETMKTTGYLNMIWFDEFLRWDPSMYGGIQNYKWPQGDVWTPDVALKNSYLDYKQLGVDSLNVKVYSTGQVDWTPFQVFLSTCTVDISYYPFDVQKCTMKFVTWNYNRVEVILLKGWYGIVMTQYENNAEWDVVETNSSIEWHTSESAISFSFKLKRKPRVVLLSLIIPITMLSVLNISVFLLPSDSGEKSGFAITVFLSFAVFLSIVSQTLPENSDKVAMFSIYLVILTLESTLITLICLVLIRIASFDHSQIPVPETLQSLLNLLSFRKICRNNKIRSEGNEDRESREINEENEENDENNVEDNTNNVEAKPIFKWKDVTNAVDKICFVLFSFIQLLATLVFFIVITTNNRI